jgi:hypothetical protein
MLIINVLKIIFISTPPTGKSSRIIGLKTITNTNKPIQMKKVMLSYLLSAFAIISCTKDESNTSFETQEVTVSATPATITDYVSENYPDASISTVLKYSGSDTSYSITLNTSEILAFDASNRLIGERLEGSCDSTNCHPGGRRHGHGHHGGGHHHAGIPIDSLPSAITDYIAANFAGFVARHADYDTLCQFGVIVNVMIDSSNTIHKKLIFETSSGFLALVHRIPADSLPATITAAVASGYPDYALRHKAELLKLSDNSLQYRMFLHNGLNRLSVVMLSDGTVVCEQ